MFGGEIFGWRRGEKVVNCYGWKRSEIEAALDEQAKKLLSFGYRRSRRTSTL